MTRQGPPKTLIAHIAARLAARKNCANDNPVWYATHTDALRGSLARLLPSGSGIDSGTTVDLDNSRADRIILLTSFHHMDEHGGYDGWSDHRVVVQPAFDGITVTVTGRDRNDIKDYLGDVFQHALTIRYAETYDSETLETTYEPIEDLTT